MKSSPTVPSFLRALFAGSALALISSCGGGGSGGGTPAPTPPPVVTGPAWPAFAGDPQHSAMSSVAAQAFNRIAWNTPVDLAPQYTTSGALLAHYGSPVIGNNNTVVVPVKTGANGGFRVEGRNGATGALVWTQDSDYAVPPHRWMPSYNATISAGRVVMPLAGGRVLVRDSVDAPTAATHTYTFYGDAAYNAAPAAYNGSVFINTPITADSNGNLYFGFMVTGSNPANVTGGIARIDTSGNGRWVAASAAAGNTFITQAAMNSAPALSNDQSTVYAVVNSTAVQNQNQNGYLVALDSTTLAVKSKIFLIDPLTTSTPARVTDDSTASPTVGPDGHVYIGVLEAAFGTHNGRGWLLQFDASLSQQLLPGAFGWDVTASLVPASMVPSYNGPSTRLLAVKYNNYEGLGTGDGKNKLAILDPAVSQADPISGKPVMREVLTITGPSVQNPATGSVYEWCINTMVVDPITKSIMANSEDGILYRWDLASNSFTQKIRITDGLGEAYTPTAIGPDGTVYAIGNARLFAIMN